MNRVESVGRIDCYTMPDDCQRRYSEEEVSAILRLAMDRGDHEEMRRDGMSLEELVEVATEAGIEPSLIRSAAERLDTLEAPARGIDWLGVRSYTEIVRVVDGDVTAENWDEVVTELRSAFSGPSGEASKLGKSSEWHASSLFTELHVSFTPEAGRTKMNARLTSRSVPLFAYGLTSGFVGLVLFLQVAPMLSLWHIPMGLALAITFGAMLGVLGMVRLAVGSWYRKMTHQMKDALDRAQMIVSRQPARQTQTSTAEVEEELREQLGSAD